MNFNSNEFELENCILHIQNVYDIPHIVVFALLCSPYIVTDVILYYIFVSSKSYQYRIEHIIIYNRFPVHISYDINVCQ